MLYSLDGITWVLSSNGNTIFTISYGLASNGIIWVAVGSGTYQIATSTDGIEWTGTSSAFDNDGRTVAWNGSLWLAGGDTSNALTYSYNGTTWAVSTSGSTTMSGGCNGITWNGKYWLACGTSDTSQGIIAYSYDGINDWTITTTSNAFFANSTVFSVTSRSLLPRIGTKSPPITVYGSYTAPAVDTVINVVFSNTFNKTPNMQATVVNTNPGSNKAAVILSSISGGGFSFYTYDPTGGAGTADSVSWIATL